MTCRACIKLPLDVYGIDAIIDNKMLKPPYIILVHLADLDNGRNPYIGTLKKEEGKILSECYSKIFNEKFLRYVNELLFEMVKTDLKDTYLGGKTPTSLKNEVSTFRKVYSDIETLVIVNQSVNKFYTNLLFKIYALPQDFILTLYIAATFFNNLRPDVRKLLIS